VSLVALSVLALASVAFAENFDTEYEKKIWQEQQSDPGSAPAPLNCSGAISISCGQTGVAGTNVGATNQTSTYNCTTFTEGGGEAIYVFTLSSEQLITATLNAGSPDLDLLLLSACDNTACIAGSFAGTTGTENITTCLQPGTYYLVVDGFGTTNAGRAFVIGLTCQPCPPPCNAICSTANDLCAGATALPLGPVQIQQDLSTGCANNHYTLTSTTGCTRFTAGGRDVVYKIDLLAGCEICVVYDRCNSITTDFDRSIYLLNTCPTGTTPINVTAFCVAGEDSTVTNTGPEDFCYTATTAGTYYLVADAFSGGGKFTLDVTTICPNATEPTSWGKVKGLYTE
jgi:hypothetical protein